MMEPDPVTRPVASETIPRPIPVAGLEYRWYHKVYAVLFVTFCLEIGFFLLIFPWTDHWDSNYFSWLIPEWHRFWQNTYVRGAISGIGVINLYIAFVEAFRLRRFARQ